MLTTANTSAAEGAPWWQTLLIVLAGGLLTMGATFAVGYCHRQTSQRTEWFRRVQWAQELTTASDGTARSSGYRVLEYLNLSTLANRDDRALLEQLSKAPSLDRLVGDDAQTVDGTAYVVDTGEQRDEEAS